MNTIIKFGNKKDVGVYSSAPIPKFRPSHCPFPRISNASQPTPRDYMYNHNLTNIIRYRWNIIYPRRRFVALPLWKESKLRSLNLQIVTFWKRLFPLAKPPSRSPKGEGWSAQPQDSIKFVWPALPRKTDLVGTKIQLIKETPKKSADYLRQLYKKGLPY